MSKESAYNPLQPVYNYYERCRKWRGEVIDYTIGVEQALEEFITKYFILAETPNEYDIKAKDFKRLLFWNTQMGLSRKKQIALDIINNRCKDFLKVHPLVEEELREIIDCRNDMAHWQLDIAGFRKTMKDETNEIHLTKEGKPNPKVYDFDKITTIIGLCRKYTTAFYMW